MLQKRIGYKSNIRIYTHTHISASSAFLTIILNVTQCYQVKRSTLLSIIKGAFGGGMMGTVALLLVRRKNEPMKMEGGVTQRKTFCFG